MKVVRMFRVERYKNRHDRLPRIRALRDEPVAADFTRESMIDFANRRRLYSIRRPIRRNHRAVEDSRVLCESDDHKIGVYLGELLRRHSVAEFCQHFQPYAEA